MKSVSETQHLFGWYESGLPSGERKKRGHFSTPLALVDQILDACGYISSADITGLRVLDPACGSGNFLARAALRLCQAAQCADVQARELVARNLWGLDPDPVACCLAEMQVSSVVESVCGSQLSSLPLHIHQADSLTLPWQPCVDLLLANPPYLAAKNSDLSGYQLARQRGQSDSYLLFLDLALKAVRPGGWIALVLPDPVLARANARNERARLLASCTLHHIWHLANVFEAEVGAVVLIARKVPPHSMHSISWVRARWSKKVASLPLTQAQQQVSQSLLAHQPDHALRYLLGTSQGHLFAQLHTGIAYSLETEVSLKVPVLLPLEHLVSVRRGEELGRNSPALRPLQEYANGYPVLRGGVDLRPYARPVAECGMDPAAVGKPLERYLAPKLLVVKSTGELQATLDTRGHIVLQTLYLLSLRHPDPTLDSAYFLLALLNSRLLRAYVYHLYTAYKLVQPQIEQAVLARLPVAWGPAEERQRISLRARQLEDICSQQATGVEWKEQISALYAEQEQAICELYTAMLSDTFNDTGVISYVRKSPDSRPGS